MEHDAPDLSKVLPSRPGLEWAERGSAVPRETDLELARLKLASLGVAIDDLTREQESYLASWRHGT